MNAQIGIYITDASFDKNSRVASISFIEITTNKKSEKQQQVNNIFEAEYIGIKECMINAAGKFNNILIICDSKQAIREAKKEVYSNKKWNRKIKDIQFIWLPREYTDLADFLTKNITKGDENKKLKLDSYKDDIERTDIMDIFVTDEDKIEIIKENILNLKSEYDFNIQYKSLHLKENLINLEIKSLYEEDREKIGKDLKELMRLNPKLLTDDRLRNTINSLFFF